MLDDIKILLGITGNEIDDKLETIQRAVDSRLRVLLGADEAPEELEYIVNEVTVIRYNRIGSEGMASHSVEGESIAYSDNDFAGFMTDIDAWQSAQASAKRGKVRFL